MRKVYPLRWLETAWIEVAVVVVAVGVLLVTGVVEEVVIDF